MSEIDFDEAFETLKSMFPNIDHEVIYQLIVEGTQSSRSRQQLQRNR